MWKSSDCHINDNGDIGVANISIIMFLELSTSEV